MKIGVLRLNLRLPGVQSLKQKRGKIKPLLNQLHKRFNVSAAEVADQDKWQQSTIAISSISNDGKHIEKLFQSIITSFESDRKDIELIHDEIEIIY